MHEDLEEKLAAATRRRRAGPARMRKLCAAAVVGVGVFAASAPAQADDAVPGSDPTASTIAAGIDAASTAASAVVAGASDAATQTVAPTASIDQSGSTSGPSADITSTASSQPSATIAAATAGAVQGATTAARTVVAAATQVVSPQQTATAAPGAVAAPAATPAAGTTDAGRQYQQNDGRYQGGNSTPISTATARGSLPETAPEGGTVSPPNPGQIPLPKCLRDLPNSVMQTDCGDAVSQLPDVASVLGSPAPHRPRPRSHPQPARATAPAAATHAAPVSVPAPAANVVVTVPAVKRVAPAPIRHVRRVAHTHRVQPVKVVRRPEPSLVVTHPDISLREAAAGERAAGPASPPLFLLALLIGLGTLAVAVGSLRVRRGTALTAIATRMRSKGLSRPTKLRPDPDRDPPPAIRYRE